MIHLIVKTKSNHGGEETLQLVTSLLHVQLDDKKIVNIAGISIRTVQHTKKKVRTGEDLAICPPGIYCQ